MTSIWAMIQTGTSDCSFGSTRIQVRSPDGRQRPCPSGRGFIYRPFTAPIRAAVGFKSCSMEASNSTRERCPLRPMPTFPGRSAPTPRPFRRTHFARDRRRRHSLGRDSPSPRVFIRGRSDQRAPACTQSAWYRNRTTCRPTQNPDSKADTITCGIDSANAWDDRGTNSSID